MTFDAAMMDTASYDAEPAVQAISLGLGGLSEGIGSMGDVVVTVDGVPDAARLSAGQFLGDGIWSVRVEDLDGLALYPSPGRHRNCQVSILLRKIDKDMGESFSIGAIFVDVDGDAGRSVIAGTEGAISQRRSSETDASPSPPMPAPNAEFVEHEPVETATPQPVPRKSVPLAPPPAPQPVLRKSEPLAPPPAPQDSRPTISTAPQAILRKFEPPDAIAPQPVERDIAQPKTTKPTAVQRVVRVTRAALAQPKVDPAPPEPMPEVGFPPPITPFPEDVLPDHGMHSWPTDEFLVEAQFQDASTPDPSDLGIAPPAAISAPARSPFAQAPAPAPMPIVETARATFVPKPAPAVEMRRSNVVPVRVAPGLRIGKFGKMGRPEDVVPVRGQNIDTQWTRQDENRSIVFVRRRPEESRSV